MKLSAVLFTYLCIFIFPPCNASAQEIVGAFEIKLGGAANSNELRLECDRALNCKFTTTSQQGSRPASQDVQILEEVRRVENIAQASNALKYAIEQRARSIQQIEFAELLTRLGPVLSNEPSVEKCWDLNYPSPTYLLACTVSDATEKGSPIYLFATLMATCGEAFCRYIIYPMARVN